MVFCCFFFFFWLFGVSFVAVWVSVLCCLLEVWVVGFLFVGCFFFCSVMSGFCCFLGSIEFELVCVDACAELFGLLFFLVWFWLCFC